jgi:hypothetical protein
MSRVFFYLLVSKINPTFPILDKETKITPYDFTIMIDPKL